MLKKLNTDFHDALNLCFIELKHIIQFRYALLTQINDRSPLHLFAHTAWLDGSFREPPKDLLSNDFFNEWSNAAVLHSYTAQQCPRLTWQPPFAWNIQHFLLVPLFQLSGKPLGALLLLHDKALFNEEELLRLAQLHVRYMSLLLEQEQLKHAWALPLDGLHSDLAQLQANVLMSHRQPDALKRLQRCAHYLSALHLNQTPRPAYPLLQQEVFNLRQLLERLNSELADKARPDFELQLADDVPLMLMGDKHLLRQLLLSLYQQAIVVYNSSRRFTLYVSAHQHANTEVALKFSVSQMHYSDTASVKNTVTADAQQMHWRLETAKTLSHLLQGDMHFASVAGQGALWFTARFQRMQVTKAAQIVTDHASTHDLMYGDAPPIQHKNFRILVAEDSPINQTVIQRMLERLGYISDVVDNGVKVLRAWEKGIYQLILMDCEMPELDGYDAAIEIRQRELATNTRIPIIALTAHALAEHRERSRASGMDEHLSKPISLPVLKNTLERWEYAQPHIPRTLPETPSLPTQEASDTATPALDAKSFAALRQALKEHLPTILRQFLDYAPQQLERLKTAWQQQDQDTLKRASHQFKSEAAQIGALELGRRCKILEMSVRSGNIDTAQLELEAIEAELQKLIPSLERELNKT